MHEWALAGSEVCLHFVVLYQHWYKRSLFSTQISVAKATQWKLNISIQKVTHKGSKSALLQSQTKLFIAHQSGGKCKPWCNQRRLIAITAFDFILECSLFAYSSPDCAKYSHFHVQSTRRLTRWLKFHEWGQAAWQPRHCSVIEIIKCLRVYVGYF